MVAQATPMTEQELADALARAKSDHERAAGEYEEADLAYRRVPILAPVLKTEARQRRNEAASILRTAGERLASARTALAQHRAAERTRQQQTVNEQPRSREAELRAADEAAFERWRQG